MTDELSEIRNPRARATFAKARGLTGPPPPLPPVHLRLFELTDEKQREEYLQLYCRRCEQRVEIIEDRPAFTSDKRYFTYVRWRDTKPDPSRYGPEIERALRREKRTYFVRLFDLAHEYEQAAAVLNDPNVVVEGEQGQFFDDGSFLHAIHWYEISFTDTGTVSLEDDPEPEPAKKKRRRRRRRKRGRRGGRGYPAVPQEAVIAALKNAPADDPFENFPGVPIS